MPLCPFVASLFRENDRANTANQHYLPAVREQGGRNNAHKMLVGGFTPACLVGPYYNLKKGDCCVFCSYGDHPCPPMQQEDD